MRGQLLVSTTNFDQTSGDWIDIYINNVINKRLYLTSFNLYSCPLSVGDVVRIEVNDVNPLITSYLNLIRRDYTTDDEGGNNGITDTNIAVSVPATSYTFTATTVNSAYDFEYRLENTLVPPPPGPTPTPSGTPEPTPTFTPTPEPSPTPSPTMTMTPTPSPTMTGTATPTPTVTGTPTPTPTLPSIACYSLTSLFTGNTFSGLNDVIQTSDYSYIFATARSGSTYNSTSIGSYVKLNNNTGLTINGGFTLDTSNDWQTVTKIEQLSNGKYVVAGYSTSGKNLRRLNSDGTDDTSFTQNVFTNPNVGLNGWITDFDVQSDGKIIAVGYFNTINGSTYEAYVRLTTTGSIDTAFYSGGTGSGFSGNATASPSAFPEVLGVKIQPNDNKILFYGSYTGYTGSASYGKITRLSSTGTIDTTFSGSTTFSTFNYKYSISALLYTSTNKILLRGFFNEATLSKNNIVMFNNDGTIDTSFIVGRGITNENSQPSCNPVELASGSYIIPCGVDNNPAIALRYNTVGFGGIIIVLPNGSIDYGPSYGGTWNCDDPAPYYPSQIRRMYFTKLIVDVNGNYVVTYRYSPTTTYVGYNNPVGDFTNGGYAILSTDGTILKC